MSVVTSRWIPRLRVLALTIALSVLIGWGARIEWLVTWGSSTEMVPNTALCVCFLYCATWVRAQRRRRDAVLMMSDGCAIGVLLMALLVLCPVPMIAHSLDTILLPYPPRMTSGVVTPGHISPGTALAFVALCVGLVVRSSWCRRACAVVAGVSLVAGHMGMLVGVTSLPALVSVGLMAIATYQDRRHV